MAKEVAVEKRAKISTAQQYMILSVMAASAVLGISISLVIHFTKVISFNSNVIAEQERSVVSYSNLIRDTGICKSPKGSIYSDQEINTCNTDAIELSEIRGTLRQKVLEDLASNEALNSVEKEDSNTCKDESGKALTYKDIEEKYNKANNSIDLAKASELIKTCSALRVIPDALPIGKNDEALLSSLDKISRLSNWQPDSLAPGNSSLSNNGLPGLNQTDLSLRFTGGVSSIMTSLHDIERSIREFDTTSFSIEWRNNELETNLSLHSYYMDPSTIKESEVKIDPEEKE